MELAKKQNPASAIYDLRINDLIAPMGIDDPHPVFSWKMRSSAVGAKQTAYAITVTSENGIRLWDTGWVCSGKSVGIRYEGLPLEDCTGYTVSVRIKDQDGEQTEAVTATFETGLPAFIRSSGHIFRYAAGDDMGFQRRADHVPLRVGSNPVQCNAGGQERGSEGVLKICGNIGNVVERHSQSPKGDAVILIDNGQFAWLICVEQLFGIRCGGGHDLDRRKAEAHIKQECDHSHSSFNHSSSSFEIRGLLPVSRYLTINTISSTSRIGAATTGVATRESMR